MTLPPTFCYQDVWIGLAVGEVGEDEFDGCEGVGILDAMANGVGIQYGEHVGIVRCAAKPAEDQVANLRRIRKRDEISCLHQVSPSAGLPPDWVVLYQVYSIKCGGASSIWGIWDWPGG